MHTSVKPDLSENQQQKIRKFLKALPHLEFTDTGLANIAKRFGTDVAVIKQMAAELSL